MLDLSLLKTLKADASFVRFCLRSWQPSGESKLAVLRVRVGSLGRPTYNRSAPTRDPALPSVMAVTVCGRECRKVYACALVSTCPVMASDLFI